MYRTRFWVSLIAILVFSAILNQMVLDSKGYLLMSRENRNYIELLAVIGTGIIGYVYYAKPKVALTRTFWLVIYGAATFFLLVMAIIDNYFFPISTKAGQYRFGTMKDYLISPLFFVLIYIFQMIIRNSESNTTTV